MKQELDELLVKKYPRIFRDRYGSMMTTAMCWGFEHGDGWFNIIDLACAAIQNHINHSRERRARDLRYNRALARAQKGDMVGLYRYFTYGKDKTNWSDYTIETAEREAKENKPRPVAEVCPQVIASQVKEKFGTLRFYTYGGDDYCHGVIDMAEYMSGRTCEECGTPGKRTSGGWISTLCEKHAEEQGKTFEGEDDV
jgi:hypothetical protein